MGDKARQSRPAGRCDPGGRCNKCRTLSDMVGRHVVPLLTKAIRRHGIPERITIDGSAAHEAAIESYNAVHGTAIAIRKVMYLNNMVAQDHRAVKRVTRPMLGFKSLVAAQGTLTAIELMHMLKKKQLVLRTAIAPPVWRGVLSSLCELFNTSHWRMISATLY